MRKVVYLAVVVAVAVMLPATASAQFDLSRALGAFFGAITKTEQTEKKEQAEQTKEQTEQTKEQTEQTKPETQRPQQNPFEMLQQLQQSQQPQKSPFEILAENAPSARLLQGSWLYSDAGAEYLGVNPLADMAIAQVEQYAKSRIVAAGIKPGSFSVTLRRNGTGTITFGERTLSGRYVYNAENATIIISGTINNVAVSVSGYVRYADGNLDILVEATSALDALLKVYPELATDQTVQMVSGMLSSFPGVYAKATFGQM
ncbi:MAG: DUF4923 family protein [Rikenellaceae bacterium]|nr:DUF4923 family protein [Rikenellaceae bacterium]